MQNRLYVANLAMDVAASSLQELFELYGFVMDVKLLSATDGKPHAALVTMATDDSAKAAIGALNGADFHGLPITVQVAREERAH